MTGIKSPNSGSEEIEESQPAMLIGKDVTLSLDTSMQRFECPDGTEIVAGSDVGLNSGKPENEDRAVVVPAKMLIAAIDGVGGETNSEEAAELLGRHFINDPGNTQLAVERASHDLFTEKMNKKSTGAACFASARIEKIEGKKYLEVFSAGDCMVVVYDKSGNIKFASRPDTWVQEKRERGKISDDEMLYDPQRHIVTRSISAEDFDVRKYDLVQLEEGDVVVTASDGVWDNLTLEEFWGIIADKSLPDGFKAVANVLDYRMQYDQDIISRTYDRPTAGRYIDGFKSMPKPDNRALAMMKVKG